MLNAAATPTAFLVGGAMGPIGLSSMQRILPWLRTDRMLPADPTDRIDPAEPNERIDPADATERMDPAEAAESIEPTDPTERIDQLLKADSELQLENTDRSELLGGRKRASDVAITPT